LLADGRKIIEQVEERLGRAARFFWEVQVPREPWDYGDSDDGFVTPLFTTIETSRLEWRDWLRGAGENSSLAYWLGDSPAAAKELGAGERLHVISANDWSVYPDSGIAICESGFWWLRWDLSRFDGYVGVNNHMGSRFTQSRDGMRLAMVAQFEGCHLSGQGLANRLTRQPA
jgi:hypothetical protein